MCNEYTRLHVLYIIDHFVCYRYNYENLPLITGVCACICVSWRLSDGWIINHNYVFPTTCVMFKQVCLQREVQNEWWHLTRIPYAHVSKTTRRVNVFNAYAWKPKICDPITYAGLSMILRCLKTKIFFFENFSRWLVLKLFRSWCHFSICRVCNVSVLCWMRKLDEYRGKSNS